MKTMPQNRESGFTLLELLLVIGVAALLLIGGIATYRLVSEGNKATEATRLLLTIRQEANVMAQSQGGVYSGLSFMSTDTPAVGATRPLVLTGVLRAQQRNPFGGVLVVQPIAAACIKMVQSINDPNQVISVSVNASGVLALPVTLVLATGATGCNAATNLITWRFP
jgi:prepilin-type N-terminal cleavage/methylation domain-containing protein